MVEYNGHIIKQPIDCECNKQPTDPEASACPVCDWGFGICINCNAAEIELDLECTNQRGNHHVRPT
jgi:hypothetical protein